MLTGRDDGGGRACLELKSSGKRSVHLVRIWNMIMLVLSNKVVCHVGFVCVIIVVLELVDESQKYVLIRSD